MTRPWHQRRPDLVREIQTDLQARYPILHLFLDARGQAEVRGTFPVLSDAGEVLDRFQVAIELPAGFPDDLPVVRETAGRIPWTAARHVEIDGKACVLLPDDRWRCFPRGASLLTFLDGPLRNFFLGQAIVERGGAWPFGEWGHASDGVYEYYAELLHTTNEAVIRRSLDLLRRPCIKDAWPCPCGSGRTIATCCKTLLLDLRTKVPPHIAAQSYRRVRETRWSRTVRRPLRPANLITIAGRPVSLPPD
ncbi:MAG: hypothetical protein AMXMBFR58_15960 [Phycisphaerae bacterium]